MSKPKTPHPPLRGTFSRGEKVNLNPLHLVGDAIGGTLRPSWTFAIHSSTHEDLTCPADWPRLKS
jgi:hypothetical protein